MTDRERTIYRPMLETINKGTAVLTAGELHPAIPTIHDIGHREGSRLKCAAEVRHLGFGLFKGTTRAGDFTFDAGGAMRQLPSDSPGSGWTPLRATPEVLEALGYDIVAARAALRELVAAKKGQ